MSSPSTLLIGSTLILCAITLCTALYAWIIYRRIQDLARKRHTLKPPLSFKETSKAVVARYSEYQHRYKSRSREIAIVGPVRRRDTAEQVDQFTDTMREHGSLLYHFTYYWGIDSPQAAQKQMADLLQKKKYHAIITYGMLSTFAAKRLSKTYGAATPLVFFGVRDTTWHESQKKEPVSHMTGIVSASTWPLRIKMFLSIKPSMKSVIIPTFHAEKHTHDISMITEILASHHVTAHIIPITDPRDIAPMITNYADKIDSLIALRSTMSAAVCKQIAATCAHHNITFFSSRLPDVRHGAAMAVSTQDERMGFQAAKKVIAILEEHTKPIDIPLSTIGENYPHEAHFNQLAMRAQGLDPEMLTTFALQHAGRVHVSFQSKQTSSQQT